jgi:hypothetical protein
MIGRLGPTFRRRVWDRPEIRYPLAGWLLFIVSAGFFVAASLRGGDPLGLAGALFFLTACFFFLPPLFAEIFNREAESADGKMEDEVQGKTADGAGGMGSGAPKTARRCEAFPADDPGDGKSP